MKLSDIQVRFQVKLDKAKRGNFRPLAKWIRSGKWTSDLSRAEREELAKLLLSCRYVNPVGAPKRSLAFRMSRNPDVENAAFSVKNYKDEQAKKGRRYGVEKEAIAIFAKQHDVDEETLHNYLHRSTQPLRRRVLGRSAKHKRT